MARSFPPGRSSRSKSFDQSASPKGPRSSSTQVPHYKKKEPSLDERPHFIHRPIARLALQAVADVMFDSRPADKVIEHYFKNQRSMGARDRRQFAELTYDLIRWWRRLIWLTQIPEPDLNRENLWPLLAAWWVERGEAVPAWDELHDWPSKRFTARKREIHSAPRAIQHSLPDWLDAIGDRELGSETWERTCRALNQPAPVVLRANALKCSRELLADRLRTENELETHPAPNTRHGLILNDRSPVFRTIAFQEGWFEVQDGASQQAAEALEAQSGEWIIDACAGAGGKTLAIGATMANKGKILALDVHEKRLQELKKRASRAGLDIVEARLIDGTKSIKRLEATADRLFLDVPCSGTGILRRNPDAKWKIREANLSSLRATQAEILSTYTRMLKPGGRLVYATCSILPSENQNAIAEFLNSEAGQGFEKLSERSFAIGENGYDGFYMAVLRLNSAALREAP
jgi:16S rRNA (cytosine967-C5)-methyltransferase